MRQELLVAILRGIKVMTKLKSIRVAGWKSIKDSGDIELRQLNVFIGANGCGKSNLVSFFKLLNEMIGERLQDFIATSGGANSVLHYGVKVTSILKARLKFETDTGPRDYQAILKYADVDRLIFTDETIECNDPGWWDELHPYRRTVEETAIVEAGKQGNKTANVVRHLVGSCRAYQFHDTSSTSAIRRPGYIENNRFLLPDGGNLAAVLYRFKESEPAAYARIVSTIRQVAPFFGDFELEPDAKTPENIRLNWREKRIDQMFGPHQMSDGTLRAIALITLLLQPENNLPTVIVIDEPELGLHPYAIGVLASLVKKAAHHCQVILATQSPALLDEFEPEDVVVVDRENRESTFKRLRPDQLDTWLDEYSFSEAWEKNVFGGGPH
jgi:predicted ATPase